MDGTRARGRSDTTATPASPKKARRSLPRRAFAIAVTVAFVLHLPLVPSKLNEWLQLLLQGQAADYDDRDAKAIIPIDLDLLNEEPSPTAVGAPPSPPAGDPPPAAPKVAGDGAMIADAGPIDAGPADAAADAEAPRKKRPVSDAGPAEDAGPADAGAPSLHDPIAAAGGAGKIAAKDSNIQVLIAGNVIRKHQLGASFARILVLIPEWHQFFADSPIDPIRDLNHLLITAPRLRGDSSKLVAVMDFNVPESKIKDAVDLIVTNAGGSWLEDAPVPTARAKVSAGDRLFALVPGKRLLVVLPYEAKDQLEGLKKSKGFPSSKVGIVISMVTPSRPFRNIFALPDTLKWMRVAVTPTADGGADVAIEGGDASEKDAQKHAPEITKAFDSVRTVNLVVTTLDVIDHAEFVADGATIKTQVHVSEAQLKRIVGMAEMQLAALSRDRAAAAASGASTAKTVPLASPAWPASPGAPASPEGPASPAAPASPLSTSTTPAPTR